jgi:acyl-CoA thioesterase-1
MDAARIQNVSPAGNGLSQDGPTLAVWRLFFDGLQAPEHPMNKPQRSSRGLVAQCLFVPLLSVLLATLLSAQTRPAATRPVDPALLPVQDTRGLPRVLLIGDSISMGYTLPVRDMLHGRANVHHPPVNCGDTARGLKNLDAWLGDKKWDVIHFNFGLHDLKYLDAAGKYVPPEQGKQVAPPAEYERNLRALVARLKTTGARLIWASTTPVPDGTLGRIAGDDVPYNAAAERVMRENDIPIDDLHAVAKAQQDKLQLRKNVHFTPEGYRELAKHVTESIESALPRRGADKS